MAEGKEAGFGGHEKTYYASGPKSGTLRALVVSVTKRTLKVILPDLDVVSIRNAL